MLRRLELCLFLAVLAIGPLGCGGGTMVKEDVAVSSPAEPATCILTEEIRTIPGPKRTVAVGNFDAIGSFKARYGDMDIGGGLAAMTMTALVESERFIVLERTNINQILAEQEFKLQKLSKGVAAPDAGKLTGVQLILYGAVTEFGEADKGGGFSFGIGGLGGSGATKLGASPQWSKGYVTIDVRVVDATTGQIIKNFTTTERVSSRSWSMSAGINQISVGNNYFVKTPLGQAARRCITNVVDEFAQITASQPWQGRIVEANRGEVFINAGENADIHKGDVFKVMRITKTFTDPVTGQTIGQQKVELGRIEVNDVQSKMSTATYVPLAVDPPQRGDLVMLP